MVQLNLTVVPENTIETDHSMTFWPCDQGKHGKCAWRTMVTDRKRLECKCPCHRPAA